MRYQIAKAFWLIWAFIPLRIGYMFSTFFYIIIYYIVGYRKTIVRQNIRFAYPMITQKELKKIEQKFYQYLCDIFFETAKLSLWDEKQIKKHIQFDNLYPVEETLKNGKSISLFLGHYGNWEWVSSLGLWIDKNIDKGQIYKQLTDPISDRIMAENRSRFGVKCIEMRQTLRWVADKHQHNRTSITGYIADQSPTQEEAKFYVDFMNKRVPALVGAEKITKRYDFDAYYLDMQRTKRGYWKAEFVKLHPNPKDLADYELTEIFYRQLTQTIYRQPQYYLWTHNRFKHAK